MKLAREPAGAQRQMAVDTTLSADKEIWRPGIFALGFAIAGAVVATSLALVIAAVTAMQLFWLPAAMLGGIAVMAWCLQRPSRWLYLLIATIFLESSNVSLHIGGARVRPAQIVLLPALAMTVLFALGGIIRLRRVPLLVPLLFYLACNSLSTLFSPVPGQCLKILILMASLVALYAVAFVLVLDDPAAWPTIFRFFVIVGLLEVGFGFYQVAAGYANVKLGVGLPIGALGIVHTEYIGTIFGRPYGSLPEPDTYGAVCIFYGLMLGLMWTTASSLPHAKRLTRLTAAAATIGLLIGIVRASWFGFLIGLAWAALLSLTGRFRGIRAFRVVAIGGLAALFIGGALTASPGLRQILARRFDTAGRTDEASLSLQNARFRQMVMSYDLFRQRPFLGNGPGSFSALGAIGAHQDYYLSEGWDLSRLYDPSIVTTVLNDTGVLGAVSFVALVAAYFSYVRRRWRRLPDSASRKAALSAHAALVGLFASFIFTHYFWLPFTWLFLAVALLHFEPEIANLRNRYRTTASRQ